MDVAQQRGIDIDLDSGLSDDNREWQCRRGVFDNVNECVTQLLDARRMDNVLDLDGSDTNSDAVSVISGPESESGEEDRDESK